MSNEKKRLVVYIEISKISSLWKAWMRNPSPQK